MFMGLRVVLRRDQETWRKQQQERWIARVVDCAPPFDCENFH